MAHVDLLAATVSYAASQIFGVLPYHRGEMSCIHAEARTVVIVELFLFVPCVNCAIECSVSSAKILSVIIVTVVIHLAIIL